MDNQKEIINCLEMLWGEINRISVTDSVYELDMMFVYAIKHLSGLHDVKRRQILLEAYQNGSGRK